MTNKMSTHRSWVSPLTAVAFCAVALTGVMMLFHVRNPYLKSLHEWMGLVMVLVGLVHLVINWKALASLFRRRAAYYALAAGVLLCVILSCFPGKDEHHGPGRDGPGGPQGQNSANAEEIE
jgi:hypothetical protein